MVTRKLMLLNHLELRLSVVGVQHCFVLDVLKVLRKNFLNTQCTQVLLFCTLNSCFDHMLNNKHTLYFVPLWNIVVFQRLSQKSLSSYKKELARWFTCLLIETKPVSLWSLPMFRQHTFLPDILTNIVLCLWGKPSKAGEDWEANCGHILVIEPVTKRGSVDVRHDGCTMIVITLQMSCLSKAFCAHQVGYHIRLSSYNVLCFPYWALIAWWWSAGDYKAVSYHML